MDVSIHECAKLSLTDRDENWHVSICSQRRYMLFLNKIDEQDCRLIIHCLKGETTIARSASTILYKSNIVEIQ